MKQRCYYAKHSAFARYGGRGIVVCERWRGDFSAFVRDMGERPPGMTIERRDNDGNYEPTNCYWANRKTQSLNRSTTRWLEHDGQRKCLEEWAYILGSNSTTLSRWLECHTLSEVIAFHAAGKFPMKRGANTPRTISLDTTCKRRA